MNIDYRHVSWAVYRIRKAIEAADQRNGMMFELGRAYALYGELCRRTGDQLKAWESIGRVIEILKTCGADGWVTKYKEELAGL